MSLTQGRHHALVRTRSLLGSLIASPELARTIPSLPPRTFVALVHEVGVEDAGELVALATTEQLVQAFDEDLFTSDRAGEREALDVGRFVLWLEVLLEAEDQIAADRIAELDEDFVAHALSGVLLVLGEEALRERLDESDDDEARQVDKSLESALSEELDGYILVAKQHEGWDAVLALVLALDQSHRALLVRLLDRLAHVGSGLIDDLDELTSVLTEGESLAEDVEAAREERRSRQGYVEPRSARAFLKLARTPPDGAEPNERDPLTRAYLRELDRSLGVAGPASDVRPAVHALPPAVLRELGELGAGSSGLLLDARTPSERGATGATGATMGAFTEALRELHRNEPTLFTDRMEELAYLTNVLMAAHERDGARLRPREAADAAMATVCFGAVLEVRAQRTTRGAQRRKPQRSAPGAAALTEVLRTSSADLLFRAASSALTAGAAAKVKSARKAGLLFSAEELEAAVR